VRRRRSSNQSLNTKHVLTVEQRQIFYEEPRLYQYRSPIFRALPFVDRAVITRPVLPIDRASLASGGVPENELMQYDLDATYMTQYNVNVQRELPWDGAVTVAYIGSRGTNLMGSGDVKTAVPEIVNAFPFLAVFAVTGHEDTESRSLVLDSQATQRFEGPPTAASAWDAAGTK
jgi:hypothetical protein